MRACLSLRLTRGRLPRPLGTFSTTPKGQGNWGRPVLKGYGRLSPGKRRRKRPSRCTGKPSVITVDLNRLDIKPGSKVLDVGCGTGRHTCAVSRLKNVIAIGMDVSFADILEDR